MSEFTMRGARIAITGGTGTFGHAFTEYALGAGVERLVIVSRDEYKQAVMRQRFPVADAGPMRYFVGDVRDQARLMRAFRGVDTVIHAAALKRVETCEYQATEAAQTNVKGTINVLLAAHVAGVKRVLLLSTDKAVQPINTYGATKMLAERLVTAFNEECGHEMTCSAVRYGNVAGSRGSVIEAWTRQQKAGLPLTITNPKATRFWMTKQDAVDLVHVALGTMRGGEVFVRECVSSRLGDAAASLHPGALHTVSQLGAGEKLHEVLLSPEEMVAKRCIQWSPDVAAILPSWSKSTDPALEPGWSWRSDWAPRLLPAGEELREILLGKEPGT